MKAGRVKGLLTLFLLFGPAFFLVFISTRGCQHKFKTLEHFGKLPAYSFQTIEGKTLSSKDFKNNVVIFTTIQKSCPSNCSIKFWQFDQLLYQQIRKNKKKLGHVKIVSFVVDSVGNPINDLKDVAFALKEEIQAYDPNVWILANGDPKQVYNIKHNNFNLYEEKGEKFFGGRAFTELVLLVDKSNEVRMVLNGSSEGQVRRMREHIALLEKEYLKAKVAAKTK
jgi:hypothetical protein